MSAPTWEQLTPQEQAAVGNLFATIRAIKLRMRAKEGK